MKRCLIIFAILLNVVGLFSQDKPNVVIWFLDNLAIGDVGYNNSEISTPNFDAFILNDGAVNLSNFRLPERHPLEQGLKPWKIWKIESTNFRFPNDIH